jgi:uncharacterized protein (DUF736 family)
MATIGTFTQQQNGGFAGSINTLTVKAKVTLAPVEKTSDNAPDFRVYAGGAEIGAAWSMQSKAGNAYLSVMIDDPSFSQAIPCRLIQTDEGHILVWNR